MSWPVEPRFGADDTVVCVATCTDTATATLKALAGQFARSGTDGLESPQVFDTPDVARAGGLPALKAFGQPADILRQTKERLFAA